MFKLCKEPAQVLRVLLVLQEEPPQGSFVYTRFATRSFLALKNLHKDRGMPKLLHAHLVLLSFEKPCGALGNKIDQG